MILNDDERIALMRSQIESIEGLLEELPKEDVASFHDARLEIQLAVNSADTISIGRLALAYASMKMEIKIFEEGIDPENRAH